MMATDPSSPRPDKRNPGEAVAELRELAAREIRALRTGDDWEGWLRIAARFPGWGITNVMLVAAQRPEATVVARYDEWQARGRQVRRGEPGIRLISELGHMPGHAEDQKPGPVGRVRSQESQESQAPGVRHVWDVAQTSGPPTDQLPGQLPAGAAGLAALWEALTWLARREGFAVERAPGVRSVTDWAGHHIRVSVGLDSQDAAQVLLHELGHVLAGGADRWAGEGTGGCRGVRKVEADSVAFIVADRLGLDASLYGWPSVASWAGSDPRARPEEAVRAAGARITRAAALVVSHLDAALYGMPSGEAPAVPADERAPGQQVAPEAEIRRALGEAERFYRERLRGGWAEGYLAGRGLGPEAARRWRAGHAPPGWTALVGHLRRGGHSDAVIEAAGLGRRSARGTLIDCFRDRVVFPVRDGRGQIAGFIGRAQPGAGPEVPKYLNSPQTAVYRKGELLFGLDEGRGLLERAAVPVIVEGPFDAIAVTEAGGGRYVGLAPCGTALTGAQVAALASVADLERVGVLVAMDGDRAGRKGIVRAYELLGPHTNRLSTIMMPAGRDPAEILQADGSAALVEALQTTEPLARVVIDAHLDGWDRELGYAEGQIAAMRAAARLIASTLPRSAADSICSAASRVFVGGGGEEPQRRGAEPDLAEIARLLPRGAIAQILRTADRTESSSYDVTAEVARAVLQARAGPASLSRRSGRHQLSGEFMRSTAYVPGAGVETNRTVSRRRSHTNGGRRSTRPRY